MKEYVSPELELLEFESEIVMGKSGCNCQYWQTTNQEHPTDSNGNGIVGDDDDDWEFDDGCSGRSAHASENNMGVAAPNWMV